MQHKSVFKNCFITLFYRSSFALSLCAYCKLSLKRRGWVQFFHFNGFGVQKQIIFLNMAFSFYKICLHCRQ